MTVADEVEALTEAIDVIGTRGTVRGIETETGTEVEIDVAHTLVLRVLDIPIMGVHAAVAQGNIRGLQTTIEERTLQRNASENGHDPALGRCLQVTLSLTIIRGISGRKISIGNGVGVGKERRGRRRRRRRRCVGPMKPHSLFDMHAWGLSVEKEKRRCKLTMGQTWYH